MKRLIANGYNVELIMPIDTKGLRTPDIVIDGVLWEIKSPEGGGKRTIARNLRRANGQSSNIIVDLQRCKLSDKVALKDLSACFNASVRIKRIKVFTKSGEILDFHK